MAYIDADSHVFECRDTWTHFDPAERQYAPPDGAAWQVEDFTVDPDFVPREGDYQIYPEGAQTLRDVPARLAQMDEMRVDVQIVFSTFWLSHDLKDPVREAAMHRSWNRWMAERSGESGGRLRWVCQVPTRHPVRAHEELAFAREHGAVGVETTGVRDDLPLGHPFFWPLFEQLQDLDMVLAVHVGGAGRLYERFPKSFYYNQILPVPGAFHQLIAARVPTKFPRLRIAFCEAGSSWVPHALSESFRANASATVRRWGEWRSRAFDYLAQSNLYVSCLIDDDFDYLAKYVGVDRMMVGSDYGHIDAGTDPDALRIVGNRDDVPGDLKKKILDGNARRCFGIEPAFQPAGSIAA